MRIAHWASYTTLTLELSFGVGQFCFAVRASDIDKDIFSYFRICNGCFYLFAALCLLALVIFDNDLFVLFIFAIVLCCNDVAVFDQLAEAVQQPGADPGNDGTYDRDQKRDEEHIVILCEHNKTGDHCGDGFHNESCLCKALDLAADVIVMEH